jgi:uncharacterized protein YuzE
MTVALFVGAEEIGKTHILPALRHN